MIISGGKGKFSKIFFMNKSFHIFKGIAAGICVLGSGIEVRNQRFFIVDKSSLHVVVVTACVEGTGLP